MNIKRPDMKHRSTIIGNWPKYLLQWGVLAAIILFMTGVIKGDEPADPEAYCPVGGLQALTTWLVNGTLPCSMTTLQIVMGIALAAAVILFSRLFCGYICPIGTVEDLLSKARRGLKLRPVTIRNGSVADKALRFIKYILLFWIFYMTATSSELFCKNLDPYYAVATGFKGEITLWMSVTTVATVLLAGFFIDSFWCRYICPLGAASNTLKFWIWIAVLFVLYAGLAAAGLEIPWPFMLAAFCILGYLLEILSGKPKAQLLYIIKDSQKCTSCGLCTVICPYHIDVASAEGGKITAVDCTLCGECTGCCPAGALKTGLRNGSGGRWMRFIPAILTVVLVISGIWLGSKFELPTIDMTWGMEKTEEDGTVTQLIDPEILRTAELTGLKSVKCYGSSMAFKARLEKIPGVFGVKTFVANHRAIVTYDPARTSPEKIREMIFVPSKFRVKSPDPASVDSIKIVTIRTENMYDRMDLNYLGLQMRNTGKKIYGLSSEFACPLIVRVYMDPSENPDKAWFKETVEMEKLQMPVHGGGTRDIETGFRFEGLEKEISYMPADEYLKMMFTPFRAEFKSRVEEHAGQPQYVYEISDPDYEKPVIRRYMPYLSNHLSRHDGIIGIYLDLNGSLQPTISIRYAAPMTEEELWKLMTMDTWTITYSEDDVREEGAKLGFQTPGTVRPYRNTGQQVQ